MNAKMSEEWRQRFVPNIVPHIEEIIRSGRVGICAGNIQITNVKSGHLSIDRKPSCDRFKIMIPFAGQSVVWDIVFYGNSAEYPPDFLFDDKSFHPDIERIKSLANWKNENSRSLFQVIEELLECYRQHQVSLVEEHSRLQFEYSSLIQQAGFSENDVEVQVHRKNRNGAVNFLIRLPIDFARIPPVLVKDNPGEDSAVLLVTFHSPEGTRITPQLFLSPRVEHALGGAANLRIPPFPNGGCLMDYVPNVCLLLKNKVDQIVKGFEKRKEYVAAFLSHFGTAVLEFEAEAFSELSLLFEWQEFYFMLHISLPVYFPQEKPLFVFQSIYHAVQGKPFRTTSNDYPYSPRWSGTEMADRAKNFILEYIPIFQKNSIRSFKG